MAGRPPENGTTGRCVAANIARLRADLGLSFTDLARRLDAAGWPMTAVTVRRIEDGSRRPSADDLVAFAVALEVSPATLLMPPDVADADTVELTGLAARADAVWGWLTAAAPVPTLTRQRLLTWPAWVQDQVLAQVAAGQATGWRNDGREAVGSARVDSVTWQP